MKRYALVVVVEAEDADTAHRTVASDTDQHVNEEVVFVGEPWEVEPADNYDTAMVVAQRPIENCPSCGATSFTIGSVELVQGMRKWARCNACGHRWNLA